MGKQPIALLLIFSIFVVSGCSNLPSGYSDWTEYFIEEKSCNWLFYKIVQSGEFGDDSGWLPFGNHLWLHDVEGATVYDAIEAFQKKECKPIWEVEVG